MDSLAGIVRNVGHLNLKSLRRGGAGRGGEERGGKKGEGRKGREGRGGKEGEGRKGVLSVVVPCRES